MKHSWNIQNVKGNTQRYCIKALLWSTNFIMKKWHLLKIPLAWKHCRTLLVHICTSTAIAKILWYWHYCLEGRISKQCSKSVSVGFLAPDIWICHLWQLPIHCLIVTTFWPRNLSMLPFFLWCSFFFYFPTHGLCQIPELFRLFSLTESVWRVKSQHDATKTWWNIPVNLLLIISLNLQHFSERTWKQLC